MVRLGLGQISDLVSCDLFDDHLTSDPKLEKLSNNIKCFYEGKTRPHNLILFDDNLLCVWDNQEQRLNCLITRDNNISIQNLIPTNAPLFDVESLIMSPQGRYVALQGTRGISVMELPRKFGPSNAYEGGKICILCRTIRLAGRFFVCNQQISPLETRWHPGSPSGSHIAILTNDDCIRIYDVTQPQICFQEIKLSESSGPELRYTKFASSLGQIGVSFDFGAPILKQKGQNGSIKQSVAGGSCWAAGHVSLIDEDSCIWPIYVLRGNGDVLLVYTDLHNSYLSKRILGPLTMRPPAEDNYGVDASSIIYLDCSPPLLVIATSSGILYHCLVLDAKDDDNTHDGGYDDDGVVVGSNSLFTNIPTLYVLESLELVLSLTSMADQDIASPLRLHKAQANPQVYFCSHEAGVHIVNVPFMNRLKSNDLTSLDEAEQSIIEHLICTKPISSSSSSMPSSIPLGIALVSRRGYFSVAILLSTGEILSQRLSSVYFENFGLNEDSQPKTSFDTPVSFSVYINQILKRTMNAPLIKSKPNTEPSKEECLQLVLNATDILRKEYLMKMEKAAEIMVKRAATLVSNKQFQLEEIAKLEREKNDIIARINSTSARYDEALEKQENLSQRIEKILETLQYRQNHLSEAESTCQKELEQINLSLDKYRNRLDQVNLKFNYQQELKEKSLQENRGDIGSGSKRGALVGHQMATVKKILTSQSEAIQQLVSQVNTLKKHASQFKLLT